MDRNDVIGKSVHDIYPEAQAIELDALDREVLASGKVGTREVDVSYPDGNTRTIIGIRFPVISSKGKVLGLGIVNHDITARKRAERELAEKEAQLRVALDSMPGGIVLLDQDLNYVLFNSQYNELYEFPDGLVRVGGSLRDVLRYLADRGDFGPGNKDELVEQVLDDYQSGKAVRERTFPGGRTIRFNMAPTPEGGYFTIHTDITERKQAEAALRESEARYRALFDNAVVGIYRTTPDGRHLEVNPTLARMRGCDTPAEFMVHFRDAGHPIYVDRTAREEMTRLMRERDYVVGLESETYRRDGTRFWMSETGRGVRNETGQLIGYEGFIEDITERKRAEEALRESERHLREAAQSAEAARERAETALTALKTIQQNLIRAEKMASLGQLTAGIAHEIKNPLNFINNFAEISGELLGELKEEIEPAVTALEEDDQDEVENLISTLSGNLGKIHEHGRRADSIVKGMLLHSRGGGDECALTDVNYLAEEALNLAYHGARAQDRQFNVTLERDLDPDVGSIDIVPQEITRVLLNLLGNGFYATQKRRQATQDGAYEPTVGLATRDLGDGIEIRVRDNGTGMSPDVIEKLFTPFFTTKPPGEGTGLALSLSYESVVQQHNGQFTVDSKEGQYTEFIITLPRQQSGEAAAPAGGGSA